MRKPLLTELRSKMQLWKRHPDTDPSPWVSTVITPQFGPDSAYGPDTTLDSNFSPDDASPALAERLSASAMSATLAKSARPGPSGGMGSSETLGSSEALGPRSFSEQGATPPHSPLNANDAVASARVQREPAHSGLPARSDANVEAGATLSTIGRYAIKGHLGAGGMGQVYEAWDAVLARAVAVKSVQLNLEPGQRAKVDAKILQQARAAAGLNHTNIVTVLDAGMSAQGVYIAMERLDGRDLAQALAQGWRPRPSQTAQIMRLLSEAVAYAHAKGVVHGNIKPSNVFIGRDASPKLLDFGIAQVAAQGGLAASDKVFSNPQYLAPEQLTDGVADRRTDIRALGLVMYELLALRKAFAGDTPDQVMQAVLLNHPIPIAQQRRNVPRTLQFVAERAMASDPTQRFSSAQEMATQLRQWSERHLDRKERVASRASRRQSGADETPRSVNAKRGGLALALGLVGLFGAWMLMPSIRTETAPAAAKANPEDEILFAKARAAAEPVLDLAPAVAPPAATIAANASAPAPGPAVASAPALVPSQTSIQGQRVVMARDDEPSSAGAAGAVAPVAAAPSTAAAAASVRAVALQDVPVLPGAVEAGPGRGARVATAPGTGSVQLVVSPWGQVEVNGVLVGLTPPMTQLSLPAGKHQITVRSDGFEPHTAQVWVLGNQSVEFRHRFKP